MNADKLLCVTGEDVRDLALPNYLPLDDAVELIANCLAEDNESVTLSSLDRLTRSPKAGRPRPRAIRSVTSSGDDGSSGDGSSGGGIMGIVAPAAAHGSGAPSTAAVEMSLDMDSWQQIGFPPAVLSAVVACKHGVTRTHLIDVDCDG